MSSTIFAFDLEDGLASGSCALCFAVAADEQRWLESFRREGKRDPEARRRFLAGGGFCHGHAWLLHELALDAGDRSTVIDLYGPLLGREAAGSLQCDACSACAATADALPRKVHFLLELLETAHGRELYAGSSGLCFRHLQRTIADASRTIGVFLRADRGTRLDALRDRLAAIDVIHADSEDVQQISSDLICAYAGNSK